MCFPWNHIFSSRLYTFIFRISWVFLEYFHDTHQEIRNTHYILFIFHSNFVFCARNLLIFYTNADPGVKCKKSDAKYLTTHFLFFAFHERFCVFYDKCIASLVNWSLNATLIVYGKEFKVHKCKWPAKSVNQHLRPNLNRPICTGW